MKNNLLKYIVGIVVGLMMGWLIFGGNGQTESPGHEGHDHAGHSEYTCSMHPQIRQDGPGKCPICGMDLIPVATSGSGGEANLAVHEMTPEAVALANIQTAPVQYLTPEKELNLTGKIEVNEQQRATLTAKFPGRIERLFVNFTGQTVQKGQKLATLYSPELLTAQRELLEALKIKQMNPQFYQAAREKLQLWKLTEAQIDQLEQSKQPITSFEVLADVGGVVTNRLVSEGDYVGTGAPLLEVANLSSVWVVLDAYESDLPWIKVGSTVEFTVPSLPGESFTAKVEFVDPLLNAATRSVAIRASAANRGGMLKPEMFVDARLKAKINYTGKQALALPKTAVLWTGKRSVVYVKAPEATQPTFERREVVLGPRLDEFYLIEKGLQANEEVVVNGVFAVDGSAQLSGNYSMMAPPANQAIEVPQGFQAQLSISVKQYWLLKDAFVASDAKETQKQAASLVKSLKGIDTKQLGSNALDRWKTLYPAISSAATAIGQATDLEVQRQSFSVLSDHLLEAVELFGTDLGVAYKQFCPMVFGNKGGYWLSDSKEIRNPYFGDQMLNCGEVKKTYP